jgi:hypothetical protein
MREEGGTQLLPFSCPHFHVTQLHLSGWPPPSPTPSLHLRMEKQRGAQNLAPTCAQTLVFHFLIGSLSHVPHLLLPHRTMEISILGANVLGCGHCVLLLALVSYSESIRLFRPGRTTKHPMVIIVV